MTKDEAPVQEPVDSMGMPLSCGKPFCAPGDHHPLCKLAAQPAPVQEPVAWMYELIIDGEVCNVECTNVNWNPEYQPFGRAGIYFVEGGKVTKTPIYTTPPAAQRQWVGLSQDEVDAMFSNTIKGKKLVNWVARAIEAKLKEKNNG
jgi:hypothetical protein